MIPLLRNALMGPGNNGYDSGRILWVIVTLAYAIAAPVFQGIALSKGQPFNMVEFGTGYAGGLATLLAAGGIGISLKDRGVAKAAQTMGASDAG